jgi:sugar lactone lactonase YvrE
MNSFYSLTDGLRPERLANKENYATPNFGHKNKSDSPSKFQMKNIMPFQSPPNILCVLILPLLILTSTLTNAQIIKTISGNNKTAISFAGFSSPSKIVHDSQGTLYISDTANNAIWRVPLKTQMEIIAGNISHQQQYSGDGGQATSAGLNSPIGIYINKTGSLYIADSGNNVIRKVDPSGLISTIAGTGVAGYSGDGGQAIQAQLNTPNDVVTDDNGNIYISDYRNNRIRKIDANGVITTIAGNGTQGYSGDWGMATNAALNRPALMDIDSYGEIYFADYGNNRIRKILKNGTVVTIAGNGVAGMSGDGGPAIMAQLNSPIGVSVGSDGNLYVSDLLNGRVRKISPSGIISSVAGNGLYADSGGVERGDYGLSLNANLADPSSVILNTDQNLYIVSPFSGRVRLILPDGIILTNIGNGAGNIQGDGGPAMSAELFGPNGIALDEAGNIYISESFGNKIRKISTDGNISTFAGTGAGGPAGDNGPAIYAALYQPRGIAFDKTGNLYVADWGNSCIRIITLDGRIKTIAGVAGFGGYDGDGGPAIAAHLSMPTSVAVDSVGNLYISDYGNSVVRKVDINGNISTLNFHYKLISPQNVAIDINDNLFISDTFGGYVYKISKDGEASIFAGTGPLADGSLIDNGVLATNAHIYPIAARPDSDGNVYIIVHNHVSRVSRDGIIVPVSGNETNINYSGDGGPSILAGLYGPSDLAFDDRGNYYIADSDSKIVRKVSDQINLNQRGLTGSWYNPRIGGQGILLESYKDLVGPNQGYASAGWFTFDLSTTKGSRWYSMQGPINSYDPYISLNIYAPSAPGNFNAPPKVGAKKVGTATLYFGDCSSGALSFNFEDGRSGLIPLSRLDQNVTCSASGDSTAATRNYLLSGAWYDPSTSGQGVYFDINPLANLLFAAWFTYVPNSTGLDEGTSQRWYTIQDSSFFSGTTSKSNLPIYEVIGGLFNYPTKITTSVVGRASLLIENCGAVTLSYNFTGGANSGKTGSINLRRIAGIPNGCSIQ